MPDANKPKWFTGLMERFDPAPAKPPTLPADTVCRLLELEPIRKAPRSLLADLAHTLVAPLGN